jgi:hypothetical protein
MKLRSHSLIFSFSRSVIQSFSHSVIQSFSYSVISIKSDPDNQIVRKATLLKFQQIPMCTGQSLFLSSSSQPAGISWFLSMLETNWSHSQWIPVVVGLSEVTKYSQWSDHKTESISRINLIKQQNQGNKDKARLEYHSKRHITQKFDFWE